MTDRLTLATSAGLPLFALAFHVTAGTVGLASGSIAIAACKGGAFHRRSGVVFVYAMLAMGLAAVGIAVYEGKEVVTGGAIAAYLVFTAWTTVSPVPGAGRRMDVALMLLAWTFALVGLAHLWRMCFGLFIATGSFVAQLVRMTFMPHWMRSLPVILVLAAGPLVVLVYWMWRVRLRQNLRGLSIAVPAARSRSSLAEG